MVISMDRWKGKVAVVTGASLGIGAAIVEHLVDAEIHVVGIARRKDKLQQLQKALEGRKGKFYIVPGDVCKEADVVEAFKWIKDNVGIVHILVNNAGVARTTTLVSGDPKLWREVLETNVMGLSIATKEALKDMRANNVDGHIIHINSIFGHKAGNLAGSNMYPAAKHAVTALTETLRHELIFRNSKVKVSSISPGLVATEIFEAAAIASGRTSVSKSTKDFLQRSPSLYPKDIADAVCYILATPPHVQVHELIIKPIGEAL